MPENADSRLYLDNEASIIAENKTHAVIALRVDKTFFKRHLRLLTSLAGIILLGEEATPRRRQARRRVS